MTDFPGLEQREPRGTRRIRPTLEVAGKIGKADPSRAELYPNKRKNGARWGSLFARSG